MDDKRLGNCADMLAVERSRRQELETLVTAAIEQQGDNPDNEYGCNPCNELGGSAWPTLDSHHPDCAYGKLVEFMEGK